MIDRTDGAYNVMGWFGWIFPSGQTVILPVNLSEKTCGIVTLESRFGIHPALEKETP